jgi:hypothetical protein
VFFSRGSKRRDKREFKVTDGEEEKKLGGRKREEGL